MEENQLHDRDNRRSPCPQLGEQIGPLCSFARPNVARAASGKVCNVAGFWVESFDVLFDQ
jgi:hypothetical protein